MQFKSYKNEECTLLTDEQTNLQPSTMLLRRIVRSPRASGNLLCSLSTCRVMVIKSVLIASAAWSIAASFPKFSYSDLAPPLCPSSKMYPQKNWSHDEHDHDYPHSQKQKHLFFQERLSVQLPKHTNVFILKTTTSKIYQKVNNRLITTPTSPVAQHHSTNRDIHPITNAAQQMHTRTKFKNIKNPLLKNSWKLSILYSKDRRRRRKRNSRRKDISIQKRWRTQYAKSNKKCRLVERSKTSLAKPLLENSWNFSVIFSKGRRKRRKRNIGRKSTDHRSSTRNVHSYKLQNIPKLLYSSKTGESLQIFALKSTTKEERGADDERRPKFRNGQGRCVLESKS